MTGSPVTSGGNVCAGYRIYIFKSFHDTVGHRRITKHFIQLTHFAVSFFIILINYVKICHTFVNKYTNLTRITPWSLRRIGLDISH